MPGRNRGERKTSFGPWWLEREIREKGPGDYIVATPTFPLLSLKALPAFLELFEETLGYGKYVGSPTKRFVFDRGAVEQFYEREDCPAWTDHRARCTVFFGHAQDPDSLEAATAKAAWLDEAGQKKFKLDSWQAIQRRLRIHKGRVLLTTTPYTLGWLKQQVWDRAKAEEAAGVLPDERVYEVINFASTMNPMFDQSEYEAARDEMPRWKHRMFYDGLFTRPAGLIYDSFDESRHLVEPFEIPQGWTHYLGLDFGAVNTAGVFLATGDNDETFYAYREYLTGGRTAEEHARAFARPGPYWDADVRLNAYGGAKSEDQWRREFKAAGFNVRQPKVSDVEIGIDRVYSAFKQDRLYVFKNLHGLRDELGSYSRKLDENGEPLEEIEDKNLWHRLDAVRYVVGDVIQRKRPRTRARSDAPTNASDFGPMGYDVRGSY